MSAWTVDARGARRSAVVDELGRVLEVQDLLDRVREREAGLFLSEPSAVDRVGDRGVVPLDPGGDDTRHEPVQPGKL